MGLGFQQIASSKVTPFWENVAREALEEGGQEAWEMGFAFTRFLHDASSGGDVRPGGIMSFGEANRTLYQGGAWTASDGPESVSAARSIR